MSTSRSPHLTAYPPCPSCGASDVVPILYGMPAAEALEAADRGDVALGGCIVGPESPELECRGCGVPLPWAARDD